jgi:transposase-like protein
MERKDIRSNPQVIELRQDIRSILHRRLREAVEIVLKEELSAALGSGWHERSEGRRGHRNGPEQRQVTTAAGSQRLRVPRGRLVALDVSQREFRSEIVRRYARRTKEVDDATLGVYLAGGNARRIRKVLEPLLGTTHLSQSAVSWVVTRLTARFAAWKERDLSQ